jgi:hypothetical protein
MTIQSCECRLDDYTLYTMFPQKNGASLQCCSFDQDLLVNVVNVQPLNFVRDVRTKHTCSYASGNNSVVVSEAAMFRTGPLVDKLCSFCRHGLLETLIDETHIYFLSGSRL